MPEGGDCLVYVAPPNNQDEPDRMPPLEKLRVLRVRQDQVVLMEGYDFSLRAYTFRKAF